MRTSDLPTNSGRRNRRASTDITRLLVSVTMVGAVCATASARADDWTSLGLDAARTRSTPERSGAAFLAREWHYTLPAVADEINRVLVSSPAVVDGFVVFGTTTGEIVALGATDGKLRWRFRARDGVHASPAIVRGKVFVPAFDGTLYALALASGKTLWTKNLGSVTFSSPAPVGDSVVVATGFPARKLLRLDAMTGKMMWETPEGAMDQASNSSVAVAGDQVIVGAMAGTYYSFDLATGAPRWNFVAKGAVHLGTPAVVGSKAYLVPGGEAHAVYAVDVQTGHGVTGWPIDIPILPPDGTVGTVKDRDYAVSSLAVAGRLLLFQQRMLELIDGDGDPAGAVDTYLMREETIAVDPTANAIVWRTANGRLVTQDRGAIPAFGVCPTPLVYADRKGRLLAVTASTLSNRVRVLDVATGTEVSSNALSAPTRGSPVLANGRLFVATNAGVMHSLLSSGNQPPLMAVSATKQPATGPTVGAVLGWPRAVDPDGDSITYALRMDSDGEILSSWEHELTLTAGETSTRLPWTLHAGAIYTYAVRARDSNGAWSDWTPSQTLRTVATPDVTVGGAKVGSLADALAMARPGDVVQLGAGTFRLTETLSVPRGVNVSGAGPQQTVLDGSGLDTSVSVRGSAANPATGIERLTVAGGRIGVSVADSRDAVLRNIVIRDAREAGIDIATEGATHVINATIVHNGIGLRAAGSADIRNSLIVDNKAGLIAPSPGRVTSNYNDVHGNETAAYENVLAGAADLDRAVAFVDAGHDDFHLKANQPTTDRGNPDDEWSNEPAPAGARVNLGAFGNTSEAETSSEPDGGQPPPTPPDGSPPPSTPPDGPPPAPTPSGATPSPFGPHPSPTQEERPITGGTQSGCEIGATGTHTAWATLAALAFVALVLRRRRGRA